MANIIRRRPFSELMGIRDEVDRFINDTVRLFDDNITERIGWKPAVDMEENKESFIITAELPGLKKEDIKVTIVDNKVMISGEVFEEKDVHEKNYFLKERVRGKFSRGFSLPAAVNPNKVEATYKDGILVLTLPKVEEAKPREITIKDS
ncbi:MAG: Hsp20/alpha crystallin family protein [Bacillota bacterium]